MRLALVFDKAREDTVGIYFERACQTLGIAYDHFWMRDAASIPPGYDCYLRIDYGEYQFDVPARLSPKVFYATDTHLPKPWKQIRRLAKRYELVCCAQRQAASRLANGAWVPLACDPGYHGHQPLGSRWDVAFVGTEGGVPRKFYLQALRERYPRSFIGHAAPTELGPIYSQAKIGFNYSIRHDVNMRIFEVLCSGALLVTNRLSHDDLERLGFRDRTHLVSYQNPQELFEILDYYLHHDAARQAIALQGMQHAQVSHTYLHRLQDILKLAHERIGLSGAGLGQGVGFPACVSS